MKPTNIEQAKKLFVAYRGSHCHMAREGDGIYEDYKKFGIPKKVETEWLRELQEESLAMLKRASNNKLKTEAFWDYADMVSRLHDTDGLQFMLEYIKTNAVFFDSNTLERCASTMLNVIDHFEDDNLENIDWKSGASKELLTLLKNELKHPVTVSDDYKENGKLPAYHSIESVHCAIRETIEGWENE